MTTDPSDLLRPLVWAAAIVVVVAGAALVLQVLVSDDDLGEPLAWLSQIVSGIIAVALGYVLGASRQPR